MTTRKAAIVTGATGYVGSNLVPFLLSAGWEVTCIVRPESKPAAHSWHGRVNYLTYTGSYESLVSGRGFAGCQVVVFHLASVATYHCPGDQIGELIAANITFGAHVLEAMPHWGASRFVNTGTFWQYDQIRRYQPVSLYAATKEAFEDIIGFYARRDNVQCVTLVLFDVYGPRDPRRKLLQLLDEYSRTGAKLALSPGMQKIDLVYISDVVAAFQTAAERLLGQDSDAMVPQRYAVGSGRRVTLKELVATYERVMEVALNIEWGGIAYREREVMEPWQPANEDILKGWCPQYDLPAGLTAIKETSL